GGFERHGPAPRLNDWESFLLSGTAQPVRDRAWLLRHKSPDEDASVEDVTDRWSVSSILGPRAVMLLARVKPGRARAVPASYVGGAGYEIYVPVEDAAALYDRLWDAGRDL